MYRCYSSNCIPLNKYCDGIKHCEHGDDELFCDSMCPIDCECNALTFDCSIPEEERQINSTFNITELTDSIPYNARKIDISGNMILSEELMLNKFVFLADLKMSQCGLDNLTEGLFEINKNIIYLDISNNLITRLTAGMFIGLNQIKLILLHGNPISIIDAFAFQYFAQLQSLRLSEYSMDKIYGNTFYGLRSLQVLDLSYDNIMQLDTGAFTGLGKLKRLNIKGNNIQQFKKEEFKSLASLDYLTGDDYMFCCFVDLDENSCEPKPDLLSSCSDLMANEVLRVFLWVMAGLSLLGNMFVLIWRFVYRERFGIQKNGGKVLVVIFWEFYLQLQVKCLF